MSRLDRVLAAITGFVVAVGGLAYVAARPDRWRSEARLVLTPRTGSGVGGADLVESFERSGIRGTVVEMLASGAVDEAADRPAGTLQVRAVPDTRVVALSLTGPRGVRDGLGRYVTAGLAAQTTLHDPWLLRVLDPPSAEVVAGPGDAPLAGAVLALALLGALATGLVTRRFRPAAAGDDAHPQAPPLREVAAR